MTNKPAPANDNPDTGKSETPLDQYGSKDVSPRQLSPAAKRALAEAEERRAAKKQADLPVEVHGREGPEPTRFGDWEKDGITSDF